ncbi:hypothetical protein RJ55_01345 [Drechmeria coniospora]|nr:hypothetical protein RJ55_01345 [Drechmeria coniospora]
MESELLEAAQLLANPVQVVDWLEVQTPGSQKRYAHSLFEHLLSEAAQPKSVSGQACVRLCGLVEQSSKSSSGELQKWAFSNEVTVSLFHFFIEWNESDHHRSMKLVLNLIERFIRTNPDRTVAKETNRCLLESIISIITGLSAKPVAKSAIKTLDHFLTRGVVTLEDIRSNYLALHQRWAQADETEVWRNFTISLFHWMRLHFVCPTAGRFVVSLYRCWRKGDEPGRPTRPSLEQWYQWLLQFLAEEPQLLESIKHYIFLPLFKADRAEGLLLLRKVNGNQIGTTAESLDMDMDVASLLQLAALEIGKKVGLVEEPAVSRELSQETESITIYEERLDAVLAHPSHEVRALALSLLVTSPSTTRPFSVATLELLRRHLSIFFADADPKFRVEVSGYVRDMFKRVRGAIHVLKRSIPRARAKAQKAGTEDKLGSTAATQPMVYRSNLIALPVSQLTDCLRYHSEFLKWYIGFLCSELTPTASYQRHITALKALTTITRLESEASKPWETDEDQQLFFDLFDEKWARALSDLLMDPFEDVRDTCAAALTRLYADERYRQLALSGDEGSQGTAEALRELSRRANAIARKTSRADHADGASRISQLLYRFLDSGADRVAFLSEMTGELNRRIVLAETDLGRAVVEAPLHSHFASLNHIWQVTSAIEMSDSEISDVQALQSSLVSCCERAWDAVRDILCDDSPEGHLPPELEESDDLDTKGLLSFSFRAIHESSNLMRTMISSIRGQSQVKCINIGEQVLEKIGNLTFTQLEKLRHRGAFTTVAMTFATCCQQTKHLDRGASLLDSWYRGTMKAIFTQRSTTRRSAGIPSLMTGILSANASIHSFEQVIDELMTIASTQVRQSETDGSNLPQVHAYNCLKDVFKNSMLMSMGNKSDAYIPQCLELAASGLRSEVWAIRNCGLIFLRSLIDRLFGSQESRAMIEAGWDGKANRIPYYRYPNLPVVLRNLLKSGHAMLNQQATTASAAESVFPALDIIRRAGPPELLRDKIQVDICIYLSSPVWHVRELAARTLTSCLLHDQWLHAIRELIADLDLSYGGNQQNRAHGVLLTLKFVIERLDEVASDRLAADLPELIRFLAGSAISTKYPTCPDISAAYLEVVNLIWSLERKSSQVISACLVTMPTSTRTNTGSALLRKQVIIHGVYLSSTEQDPVGYLRTLLLDRNVGVDTLVSALETLPRLWDLPSTSEDTLSQLCNLYLDLCLRTVFPEALTVAVQNMAQVMDELLGRNIVGKLSSKSLIGVWTALPARPISPALFNAIIRASGCIMAVVRESQGDVVDLASWGRMMADASQDDRTFDSRFAAVSSLLSYFTFTGGSSTTEEHLPALCALYDSLNDDDDEIREVGCAAVKGITGESLVPMEAANRLLGWLMRHFHTSSVFASEVIGRMVGHAGQGTHASGLDFTAWTSAEDELTRSMESDDSLFVVEEQNLFVDEVRETMRWASVFERLPWDAADARLASLDCWITKGIIHLGKLSERDDGPLGWASNPELFAICTRLIRGSEVMSKQHASGGLRQAVADTQKALKRHKTHVSKLLTGAWE